jgi:peptidyl-prolyl cis-trans isomerase SurA
MLRISKAFLPLFALALLALPGAYAAPTVIERVEASVNSSVILKSDLQRFRRNLGLRSQLDPLFGGTALAQEGVKASDAAILEFLIDEKIILQQFPMTDAEVEAEVNSIQANNHISREQLKQAIAAQGFDFKDYFELIRVGAAKRNLVDREIRTKVTVSDDDVRSYYLSTYAKGKPTPMAYQVFIITNKDRTRIASAAKAIASGRDFSAVAKDVSQDPSAENGGELGTLTEDQMNKGIRDQLKKMKPGETSPVLGSAKSGWFILHLGAVKVAEDQHMKAASDQIRAQIAGTEYQRQLALWLERQRQTAFIRRAGDPPVAGLPKGI